MELGSDLLLAVACDRAAETCKAVERKLLGCCGGISLNELQLERLPPLSLGHSQRRLPQRGEHSTAVGIAGGKRFVFPLT